MSNNLFKIFSKSFVICKKYLHLYMVKKKQKGGRKPIDPQEKVILVGFYVKRKDVDRVGGIYRARDIAKESIEHYDPY